MKETMIIFSHFVPEGIINIIDWYSIKGDNIIVISYDKRHKSFIVKILSDYGVRYLENINS